jgi:DNA-binding GntR family transcriptional regulator
MLEVEGLVILRQGRGGVVAKLDVDEINELFSLRLLLEPPLAEPMIEGVRPTDLRALDRQAKQMTAVFAADPVQWSSLNSEFHQHMYSLANRPHTLRLVSQLINLVAPYTRIYLYMLEAADKSPTSFAEHREMLDALRDGDAKELRRCIYAHIDHARLRLTSAMRDEKSEEKPMQKLFASMSANATKTRSRTTGAGGVDSSPVPGA